MDKGLEERQDLTIDASSANDGFRGNGSVAHLIIGQFLNTLAKDQKYSAIASTLAEVLYSEKPSESAIRTAIFGEVEL